MKIADVQILFYAIDPTSELHAAAARWLEGAINDREPMDSPGRRSTSAAACRGT